MPPAGGGVQYHNLEHLALGVLVLAAYQSQLMLIQQLVESLWRAIHTFLIHVDLKFDQLAYRLQAWSRSDPNLANVHVPQPSFRLFLWLLA